MVRLYGSGWWQDSDIFIRQLHFATAIVSRCEPVGPQVESMVISDIGGRLGLNLEGGRAGSSTTGHNWDAPSGGSV